MFEAIDNVEVLGEIPKTVTELMDLVLHENRKILLLIDDFQQQFFSSSVMAECYTRLSHHAQIDCCAIIQNAFPSKVSSSTNYFQDIWRNCTCYLVFRTPGDSQYLNNISLKLFGKGKSGYLSDCMQTMSNLLGARAYLYLDLDVEKVSTLQYPVRSLLVKEGNFPSPILFKCP